MRCKNRVFFIFLLLFLLCASGPAGAQVKSPVRWQFQAIDLGGQVVRLECTALLEEGWYLFATAAPEENNVALTSFSFEPNRCYDLLGEAESDFSNRTAIEDNLTRLEKEVVFTQLVLMKSPSAVIKGSVRFVCGSNGTNLPAEIINFSIAASTSHVTPNPDSSSSDLIQPSSNADTDGNNTGQTLATTGTSGSDVPAVVHNMMIFVIGFTSGIAILLIPGACRYLRQALKH